MRRKPQGRLAKITVVLLFAGVLTSCSTTTPTNPNPGTGNLITIVQDVPLCNAISANVVIQNLSFTPVESTNPQGYMTTTPSFAPEIRLNLQQLRDFSTILYSYPVRAGSYNQMNLDFELAQLAAYDATLTPPVRNYTVNFTNSKPIIPLNPPLVITSGQTNVMVLDFDVLRMLATNSSGNLTGQIIPIVSLTQLSATSPNGATSNWWRRTRGTSPSSWSAMPASAYLVRCAELFERYRDSGRGSTRELRLPFFTPAWCTFVQRSPQEEVPWNSIWPHR